MAQATQLCPKCNRNLIASGEATIEFNEQTITLPVFQCDECLVVVDFMGDKMEMALTFARRPDGTLFDPGDPDGTLQI